MVAMKVEIIAECSHCNILQYFWPALSNNLSWKPIFGILFEWQLNTGFTVSPISKQNVWWHITHITLKQLVYLINSRPPDEEWIIENYFTCFSTETHVVETQKNRLDETSLLSTQNN